MSGWTLLIVILGLLLISGLIIFHFLSKKDKVEENELKDNIYTLW